MSINPKLLEDAKLVNKGLYQTNGGKKFAEKKGIGNARGSETLSGTRQTNEVVRLNLGSGNRNKPLEKL